MPKLVNLNVVNVDTNYSVAPAQAGFNTVAYLNPDTTANKPSLEKYSSLAQMSNYDPSSDVYKAAAQYFNNPNSSLFEVITGSPKLDTSNESEKDKHIDAILNRIDTDLNTQLGNLNKNSKTSDVSNISKLIDNINKDLKENKIDDNLKSNINSDKYLNAINNDINNSEDPSNDAEAFQYVIDGYFESKIESRQNIGLVNALSKYYNSGAEYFLYNINISADRGEDISRATGPYGECAIQLANFVESQSSGVLLIDVNYSTSEYHDGHEPDFSWLSPIADDKSVMVVALPDAPDFGAALLGVRANQSPNANIEMIHNLTGIKPQDAYTFTVSDYETYFGQFNVATYAYRNGIPMLTSGDSDSGYQWSNMIVRDYTNYQIISRITALLVKNNGDPGIPYNAQGIGLIEDQLRLVLSAEQRNNMISYYHINPININRIPQSEIAEGQLNGLSYDWSPTDNITGVTFHQQIDMPGLNRTGITHLTPADEQ